MRHTHSIETVFYLHGRENVNFGGPTILARTMAAELRRMGHKAAVSSDADEYVHPHIGHVFNIWDYHTACSMLASLHERKVPIVFSPTFINLAELNVLGNQVPAAFESGFTPSKLHAWLVSLKNTALAKNLWDPERPLMDPVGNSFQKIREMLGVSDHVLCLSSLERDQLKQLKLDECKTTLLHNAIDVGRFRNADPELFTHTYGVRDFVLCVGRLEARKNQILLSYALRNENIPLVLIGKPSSDRIKQLILAHGGSQTHIIEYLPPGSDLLASAYAAARVFVLPSWCEGAPLSALEAGAAGTRLVLSNRSAESEYFQDFAAYCDPSDIDSIRHQVLEAFETPLSEAQKQAQQNFIAERYDLPIHVGKLVECYLEVASRHGLLNSGKDFQAEVPKYQEGVSVCTQGQSSIPQIHNAMKHLGHPAPSVKFTTEMPSMGGSPVATSVGIRQRWKGRMRLLLYGLPWPVQSAIRFRLWPFMARMFKKGRL